MKPIYECHITMKGCQETIKQMVESTGWKFSAIDGDPVLGNGVLCYATSHFKGTHNTVDVVIAMGIVADGLIEKGVEVLRQKVELVVYDTKALKRESA